MRVVNVEISIDLHQGQKDIFNNQSRYNAVNCGRRFGKTTMSKWLVTTIGLLAPIPIGYFAPTYKDLLPVWKALKAALSPVIEQTNEAEKAILLKNGSRIEFWSFDNVDAGRGRAYGLIIVDEVEKMRSFHDRWYQTIRPTLVDFQGTAWLFSTPRGKHTDWYRLCTIDDPAWKYHHAPTWANPFIPKAEIEAIRKETPALEFAQEIEAKFVDIGAHLFFYEFNRKKHVTDERFSIHKDIPVWLSFDFNVNPCTAVVGQINYNEGWAHIYEVHQVDGGTSDLCLAIADLYKDFDLKVTGDYSGATRTSVGGSTTDYDIIKDAFDLDYWQLIDTETANRRHVYSRKLCNFFLRNADFLISDPDGDNQLVYDLETALPTKAGNLVKDRKDNKQDAGDAFRYLVNAWFSENDLFYSGINGIREFCALPERG